MPNYQGVWSLSTQFQNASGWPVAPTGIALLAGGTQGSLVPDNNIETFIMPSAGTVTDFGDLTVARWGGPGIGNATRSIFGGGYVSGAGKIIDYVTPTSAGNATDWGTASTYEHKGGAGGNNDTRGLLILGEGGFQYIEYLTIATTGSVSDFGTASVAANYGGGVNSNTRCVFGLSAGTKVNTLEYVTTATTGNASDFGDLLNTPQGSAGVDSSTRGVFAGGDTGSYTNVIQYITMASLGNATDFGDLTAAKSYMSQRVSDKVSGFYCGGSTGTVQSTIEKITIASTGNGVDFGDLLRAPSSPMGVSTSHGGLS